MAQRSDPEDGVATGRNASDRGRRDRLLARLLRLDRECIEPDPVDPDRYRQVNEAFVDAVRPHPSVVAIYGDSRTPTVPGISDADFTVVVEDDVEDVDGLVAAVDGVLERFPRVCTHGPGILPESVAEYYPLFDVFTLGLDHLAGDPIAPVVEETELTNALRLLDNFVFRAYRYLIACVTSRPSVRGVDLPAVSLAVNFVGPIAATIRGAPVLSGDRLVLDKSSGLYVMSNPKYDLGKFENAVGRESTVNPGVVDLAREFRTSYFEEKPSDERYLSLFLDLLEFKYELIHEFVAEQTIYATDEATFYFRRGSPTIASPAFHDLSPYDVVDLCLDSDTTGEILPPEVAHHLATFPFADDLFYGTPPEPDVRRPEAARLLDLRRRVFEELIAFKYDSGIADAMPETFCFPHVVGFVDGNSSVGEDGVSGAATAVKTQLRDVRNRFVLRAWNRRLSRKTSGL